MPSSENSVSISSAPVKKAPMKAAGKPVMRGISALRNTCFHNTWFSFRPLARAKGLSQQRVLWKHIFRNALIPIVTGFPSAFIGAFFTGALLIETLFSLDGLGLLSYESIVRRDYPVVLGSLYLFTLIGLVVKLISDVIYTLVDPRVQFGAVGK